MRSGAAAKGEVGIASAAVGAVSVGFRSAASEVFAPGSAIDAEG